MDGNQSKAEKAMSTSKGSVSENVKETSENKPDGGKDDETAEDDEPLVGRRFCPCIIVGSPRLTYVPYFLCFKISDYIGDFVILLVLCTSFSLPSLG